MGYKEIMYDLCLKAQPHRCLGSSAAANTAEEWGSKQ